MQNRLKPPARPSNARLQRLERLARSAPERARRGTDGARIRARRALHRRGYVPGLLSIVVPCYRVEDFLDECLVSLRFQEYREVEIIVVDDGSPDRSGSIARHHARRDLRVRVVTRENGGLSAARNTGIEHARGEFLTFVDSDDVVTPDAYTSVIGALQESGSDFAVSCYDRLENKKRVPAGSWIRSTHAIRRLGVDLDTFPEVMVNAVAWSKTYRRTFWDSAGLRFPEGKIYEDQQVSAAAFAQARAFDVVPEIGVSWRIRNDRSSISQSAYSTANLAAHNEAVAASFAALQAAGKERAVQIRALQLISFNMPFFTRHLAKGGPEFWALLRTALLDLVPRVSREEFVHSVGAQDKVLVELIANDRREAAVDYIENWGNDARRFPTTVTPEGVRVELPLTEGLPDDVTRDVGPPAGADQPRDAGGLGRRPADRLRLGLHPQPRPRRQPAGDPRRAGLGRPPDPDPPRDRVVPRAPGRRDGRPLALRLPARRLPGVDRGRRGAGRRRPGLGLRDHDDRGRHPAYDAAPRGLGGRLVGGPADPSRARGRRPDGAARVGAELRPPGGPLPDVRRVPDRRTERRRRRVGFRSNVSDPPDRVIVNHIDQERRELLSAPVTRGTEPGEWRVDLDLSSLPMPTSGTTQLGPVTRPLRVRVRHRSGEHSPLLAPPGTAPSPAVVDDPAAVRRLTRGKAGELELMDRVPVATDVRAHRGHLHRPGPLQPAARRPSPRCSARPDHEVRRDPHPRRRRRRRADLPADRLPVRLRRPGAAQGSVRRDPRGRGDDRQQDLPVTPSPALLDRLPVEEPMTRIRALVEVFPHKLPVLTLNVQEPLADDVRGQRNQYRLREAARVEEATQDSVFFRSLYSEVTNCNMLGVHHELGRRGSSLTRYWSVRDHTVPVPEGGVGLIEGTPEWHEALATSRYVMVNVHQPEWYTKPRGQVLIETMHGYPYKVMGHEWWEKGGFPTGQINSFDRRARDWDYFVSPATYATPLLREAFLDPAGATPEVLEIGYPRNDVLQSDEAPEIRERVRKALGHPRQPDAS